MKVRAVLLVLSVALALVFVSQGVPVAQSHPLRAAAEEAARLKATVRWRRARPRLATGGTNRGGTEPRAYRR